MRISINFLSGLGTASRVFVGTVFLLSAALKALDFQAFAVLVSWYGFGKIAFGVWWGACGVVVLESALGSALLVSFGRRRLFLVVAEIMLFIFVALIIYGWVFRDLSECGCFGRFIHMSPFWSLVKSVLLITLTAVAWLTAQGTNPENRLRRVRFRRVMDVVVLSVALGITLCATWTTIMSTRWSKNLDQKMNQNLTGLARYTFTWKDAEISLSKGEYLVVMLSDSCEQCEKIVASLNRLAVNPDFPTVVGLLPGTEETRAFFQERYRPAFATKVLPPLDFFLHIDNTPPRFYVMRDGMVLEKWDKEVPEENVVWKKLIETSQGAE